jgi:hypothetical protein
MCAKAVVKGLVFAVIVDVGLVRAVFPIWGRRLVINCKTAEARLHECRLVVRRVHPLLVHLERRARKGAITVSQTVPEHPF